MDQGTPLRESSSGSNLNDLRDTKIRLLEEALESNKNLIRVLEGTIVSKSWKITELESEIRQYEIQIDRLNKVKSKKSFWYQFFKHFKA